MKNFIRYSALALAAFAPLSHAGVNGIITTALSNGGEKLGELDNGKEMRAGGFWSIAGGLEFTPENSNFEFVTTLGYKFDSLSASNFDQSFQHFPLEFLAFFRQDQHRFGGGLAIHTNTVWELEDNYSSDNMKIKFENAKGIVLQYDFLASDAISWGLRFEKVNYQANKICFNGDCVNVSGGDDINGNSISVTAGFRFGANN